MNLPTSDPPELLITGPKNSKWTVVFAHGAGAAMDTPFMNAIADGLGKHKVRVIRFEFPYMAESRRSEKRRPPDREPKLRATWQRVIDSQNTDRLVIGGKSMGGRIASLMADEASVAGLVCLGYPFHPTGKPDKLRTAHLESIVTPTLIIQGERDPFGNRDEVAGYTLSQQIRLHWLTDGDHSFKPRKTSGRSLEKNIDEAVACIAAFLETL